jgi:hypothetical protein
MIIRRYHVVAQPLSEVFNSLDHGEAHQLVTVVLYPFLHVYLKQAVVVSWVLHSVPSVNLLVEEIVHDDVAVDAPSDIHVVDFGLLEIRVQSDLKCRKDGSLGLVQLEPVVPVLKQLEGFLDVVPHGVSLCFGLQRYLKCGF